MNLQDIELFQTKFARQKLEWIFGTKAEIFGVQAAGGDHPPTSDDEFFRAWITTDTNRHIMQQRNDMAMRWLCYSLNIPMIETHIEEFFTPENDRGRDLLHPGPEQHKIMADNLLNKISTNL